MSRWILIDLILSRPLALVSTNGLVTRLARLAPFPPLHVDTIYMHLQQNHANSGTGFPSLLPNELIIATRRGTSSSNSRPSDYWENLMVSIAPSLIGLRSMCYLHLRSTSGGASQSVLKAESWDPQKQAHSVHPGFNSKHFSALSRLRTMVGYQSDMWYTPTWGYCSEH